MSVTGLVIVALPLLVSVVICVVARREGLSVPTRPMLRLVAATIAAVALSLLFPRPIAAVVMFAILFVAFAIPVMQSLERSAKAQLPGDDIRSASLVPRAVNTYVPLWVRAAGAVAMLAGFAWVVARATTTSSPLTMLLGFAFAGLTFFGLYETWMRQEVFSVRARDEDDRRRRVRAVFAAQIALTLSFLLMAGLSTGPWPGLVALGAAATIIGGTGCAFSLSTGIQERYLQAWTVRRDSQPRL